MIELPATVELFRTGLLEWSRDNLRSFHWRDTADPYEIFLAEFLLQRTAAEKVEPIYLELIEKYPDFAALSEAEVGNLEEIIFPLGLQKKRSSALHEIAERLGHDGVPGEEQQLLELPFIGRYCANAILCFGFDQPCPILDRNVIRIYERAFDIKLHYRDDKSWEFAARMLPNSEVERYNLALLDFAAETCRAPRPKCETCFFSDYCVAYPEILDE